MSKLSLDALRERAEAVASEDLLATISGGTENACHDEPNTTEKPKDPSRYPYNPTGNPVKDFVGGVMWWVGLVGN